MSLNIPMGVQLVAMNYGDGLTGLNTLNHTYSGAGLFVPTAIVTNPQNTGLTQFCNGSAITTSQCTNNNQCP